MALEYFYEDNDFQIGFTPQTLATLTRMKISIPDQVVYSAASVYYVRADGTRVGDGYASANWIWDVMKYEDVFALMGFLDGNDHNLVYIKTDKRDGTSPNPRTAFDVFQCIMWKPVLSGEEGLPIARSPYAYQSVRFHFTNLIAQPGYL